MRRQSSQPSALGVTSRIVCRWVQGGPLTASPRIHGPRIDVGELDEVAAGILDERGPDLGGAEVDTRAGLADEGDAAAAS